MYGKNVPNHQPAYVKHLDPAVHSCPFSWRCPASARFFSPPGTVRRGDMVQGDPRRLRHFHQILFGQHHPQVFQDFSGRFKWLRPSVSPANIWGFLSFPMGCLWFSYSFSLKEPFSAPKLSCSAIKDLQNPWPSIAIIPCCYHRWAGCMNVYTHFHSWQDKLISFKPAPIIINHKCHT